MSTLSRLFVFKTLRKPKSTPQSLRLLARNLTEDPKPPNKLTSYILNRYVKFVKSYEVVLQKNFPAAFKFYQVFSVGLKYFKDDVGVLFEASKKVSTKGLGSLTRKELEVYDRMPKDMMRAAPVVIIGVGVPFCGFVFIVAYYFPRLLLTPHFWSLQQKSEFALLAHKKKLQSYKPVFRCMQSQLSSIQGDPLFNNMKKILESLGSGVHPSADLILSCKPLFEKCPYDLQHLTRHHVVCLLKLHNLHRGWRRRKRLQYKAQYIQLIDAAIVREGGLEALTQDELKKHCFLRGLNPINMRNEDIFNWMQTWLMISKEVDKNSSSLLLHCPILLGYNQPSNWGLLHDNRI